LTGIGGARSTSATAADLSVDQVRAALRNASPSAPADFAGKDLSDLDRTGRWAARQRFLSVVMSIPSLLVRLPVRSYIDSFLIAAKRWRGTRRANWAAGACAWRASARMR
jgi:hypothetical protein